MFFSISAQQQDNFSSHWNVDNVYVDTDAGWKFQKHGAKVYIFKGYADEFDLEENVSTVEVQDCVLGNFCVIVLDSGTKTIKIVTDLYRSFPLYFEEQNKITNLYPMTNTAWTDSVLTADFDLNVIETKIDVIGEVETSELSYKNALEVVDNILESKTKKFLKLNRLPIKVFLSGGVDTLLVYSYLRKLKADVELLECNHFDHDYFWRNNHHYIKKFWGYSQIHHYREPCVLASGAPGDEFMLRSPVTADRYLKRYKTSIPELLVEDQECLHYEYFKKNQTVFNQENVNPKDFTDWGLCNNIVNDWQHWHLGNTLTWTPLRDLAIFKAILRLPKQYAIGQILNSDFSKQLIEQNAPGFTELISDQKNHGASLKNLNKFFG